MRLGNYWMRLHKKLKELQADRKASESPLPEPAKPKSKNEPGVVEISSFQRHSGNAANETRETNPAPKPESGKDPSCTGK